MEYKSLEHITLNQKLYSKQDILSLEIKEDSHFKEVISFLKKWFNDSDKIEVQTSGSTGKPKRISIPKQSFVESAINTCDYLKLTEDINALLCIPVHYIGGKMMVIRSLVCGYNLVVVEPSKNPLENLTTPIHFIAITPYQAFYMGAKAKNEFKAIDIVLIGGGKLNSLAEESISRYTNRIYSTFGMTETVSHIALKKINGPDKSDQFTVFDAYSISKNEENCLVIDCPSLSDSLIETNDIIEITSENKFKWLGRKDNVINSGGIKIYPEEIEEILSPILLGLKFYISSKPDEILGNKLVLNYTNEGGINITPRLSFINSKLEKHKTIKEIIYLDSFEYTKNGKLIRN